MWNFFPFKNDQNFSFSGKGNYYFFKCFVRLKGCKRFELEHISCNLLLYVNCMLILGYIEGFKFFKNQFLKFLLCFSYLQL